MNDALKIVLGASGGFLVGVLIEPIKFWLAERLRRDQMRKALLGNVAYLCGQFTYVQHVRSMKPVSHESDIFVYSYSIEYVSGESASARVIRVLDSMKLDVFEHYYNAEKAMFWRMPIAGRVRELFESARPALVSGSNYEKRLESINEFLVILKTLLDEGYLRKRFLAGRFRQYFHRELDDALAPYGDSYGEHRGLVKRIHRKVGPP